MILRRLTYAALLIFASDYVFPQEISRDKRSSDDIPCEYGWFHFNGKCYRIGGKTQTLSWPKAAEHCTKLGATLVTIETKEENDFLTALILLEVRKPTWIGLNDRMNESDYQWQSGSTSEYRNWNIYEPSEFLRESDDCIEILSDMFQDYVGVWNDADCENSCAYICEKNSNSTLRSPDLQYCASDQGGGVRFGSSCYHSVMEMKTWEKAEQHCEQHHDGHLITVLDKTVDYFLKYHFLNLRSETWIGIKIRDQFQQKWSSGWYVGYIGFSKGIQHFIEGTCVVRSQRKEWNIVQCSRNYTFICEKSREELPVLKLPEKDSYCPRIPLDWRNLDGEFCYFFETENPVSWYEANFLCTQRGGNLLSMHSKDESDILHPFIQYTGPGAFIGLYGQFGEDNTFRWTDGSKLDFMNWNHGKPNDEKEKCVEAQGTDMKWNVINCDEKRPFICAVTKITLNIATTTETTTENPEFGSSVTPSIEASAKPEFDSSGSIYKNALIGFAVCIVLLIIFLVVLTYNFRIKFTKRKKNSSDVCFQPPVPAVTPHMYRPADIRINEQDPYYETMDD